MTEDASKSMTEEASKSMTGDATEKVSSDENRAAVESGSKVTSLPTSKGET